MKRISMLSQQSITIICQGAKDNHAQDVSCLARDTIEKKITCKHVTLCKGTINPAILSLSPLRNSPIQ